MSTRYLAEYVGSGAVIPVTLSITQGQSPSLVKQTSPIRTITQSQSSSINKVTNKVFIPNLFYNDTFTGSTINTFWNSTGTTPTESGGFLHEAVGSANSADPSYYSSFIGVNNLDLRGKSIVIEAIPEAATSGVNRYFDVQPSDGSNGSDQIQRDTTTTAQGGNDIKAAQLLFDTRNTSNVYSLIAQPTYDSVAMRWWRMRFTADGTTTYFDTSPDGVTWTNRATSTTVWNRANASLYIGAGQYANPAISISSDVIWDNVTIQRNSTTLTFAGIKSNSVAISITQSQSITISRSIAAVKISAPVLSSLTRSVSIIKPYFLPQTQSVTISRLHINSKVYLITQSQTVTISKGHSSPITEAATQGQSTAVVKQVGIIRSATQTRSTSITKSEAVTKAITQGQGTSLFRQDGKIITPTQGQSVTISRSNARTISISKSSTVTIIRTTNHFVPLITQGQNVVYSGIRAFLRTISVTQGQSTFLVRSDAKVYNLSQAQSIVRTDLVSLTRSPTQGQLTSLNRITNRTRLITQAQGIFYSGTKAYLRTISITQAQALTLTRIDNLVRAISQGQALTLSKQANRNLVLSQGDLASLVRQINKKETLTQGQSTTINLVHSNFRPLIVIQNSSPLLSRQTLITRSILGSSNVLMGRTNIKTLPITEASIINYSKQTNKPFRIPQGQGLNLSKGENKIFTLAQAQLVIFSAPLPGKRFIISQGQSVILLIIPYLPSSEEEIFVMVAPNQMLPFFVPEDSVIPFYVPPVPEDQVIPITITEDTQLGVFYPSSLIGSGTLP